MEPTKERMPDDAPDPLDPLSFPRRSHNAEQ
jgi:hypothetical protein